MKKIKVLHICPDMRRGGAQQLLLDIFRNFNHKRFQLYLFSFRKNSDNIAKDIEKAGYRVFYANVGRPYHNPHILIEAIKLIRQKKFDIVHTHLQRGCTYGRLAAWLCGTPIIVMTEHGGVRPKKIKHRLEDKFLNRITDKVIFISDSDKHYYSRGNYDQSRYVRIHNCIDVKRFSSTVKKSNRLQHFGFSSNEILIGMVGNLFYYKGHIYLLDAISQITRSEPSIKLILIGWGPQEAYLKKYVSDLGINRYVYFLGERHDVPDLLSVFDIFVLPSLYESFAIVLLEAMYCNLPIVATNVGGIPEVIEDGKNGFLVPPADSRALMKPIMKLISDSKLREQMGNSGRKKVLSYFTTERYVLKLQELYEDLLKAKGMKT